MPRQARTKSEFGIYPVMMRGINRQNIFDDEEDYNRFIRILSSLPFAKKDAGDSCQRHNSTIYAWCLMTMNISEFQLLPRDVQDMAVSSILDAGASVRQAVSHTGLTTKQIRKRYDK